MCIVAEIRYKIWLPNSEMMIIKIYIMSMPRDEPLLLVDVYYQSPRTWARSLEFCCFKLLCSLSSSWM
jgi:hypothetical protein